MTIEEFIPKIDDNYYDTKGYLHIDTNIPIGNIKDNFERFNYFYNSGQLEKRLRDLYNLENYVLDKIYTYAGFYLLSKWKLKD